ncbi:MAG TPA: hypothetical protein PK156_42030 [Polyangium sp.]|nr:hypothetical protein [Polyangium sp.]
MAFVSTAGAQPAELAAIGSEPTRPLRFGAVFGIDLLGSTTYFSTSTQALGAFIGFKAPRVVLGVGGEVFIGSDFITGSRAFTDAIVGTVRIEGQVAILRTPDERVEAFVLAAYGWATGDPLLDAQAVSTNLPSGPVYGGMGIGYWSKPWMNVQLSAGVMGIWNSRSKSRFDPDENYEQATKISPCARLRISFVVDPQISGDRRRR